MSDKPLSFIPDSFVPDEQHQEQQPSSIYDKAKNWGDYLFGWHPEQLKGMLESAARPQSVGDVAGLLIPEVPSVSKYFKVTRPVAKAAEAAKDIELPAEQVTKQAPKLLSAAKGYQLPEGSIKQPSIAESGYYQTGKPVEQLHPNDIRPASEIINQLHPEGNTPSLEDVHSAIQTPEQEHLPPPGSARTKGINALAANVGSADQVLESREATKPIVNLVRNAWDDSRAAVGKNIRQLDDITSGLNDKQLELFGRASEGHQVDLSSITNVEQKLTQYRALMDDIFKGAKIARRGALGYIRDYLTHIQKAPEDFASGIKDIFNYRQMKDAARALFETEQIGAKGTGEAAGIYGKGVGQVAESPFAKRRTDALENLDYNVNRLGRAYIDSMARETYLRPAVERATELVKGLPDSKSKELSEWYIKNITRFDASPQLNAAYKKVVRAVLDTTARSMLGFSPRLQELHAMRLGPVYAELGPKYSAMGLGQLVKNPLAAYRETAELGMLPQELYPFRFQTAGERVYSILNFKSMVDFIDRNIAYNGFKAKYLDSGMESAQATRQAITDAKRVTFMVDPARQARMLNPEYSNVMGRLTAQYKQVPAKIVEWIYNTAAQYKDNPAAARRMITLLGANVASQAVGGPSIFHMPVSLADWSAASVNEMRKIVTSAVKGDVEGALGELALWLTPAGKSMERLFK